MFDATIKDHPNRARVEIPHSSPQSQIELRRGLIARCKVETIKGILAEIAGAVRAHNGLWAGGQIGPEGKPSVEIEVHGVVAHGKDGPSACRNWIREAQKQEGHAL